MKTNVKQNLAICLSSKIDTIEIKWYRSNIVRLWYVSA